jgi:hypothetical protein
MVALVGGKETRRALYYCTSRAANAHGSLPLSNLKGSCGREIQDEHILVRTLNRSDGHAVEHEHSGRMILIESITAPLPCVHRELLGAHP